MKSLQLLLIGVATLSSSALCYADEAGESRMRDMLKQAVLQQRAAQDESAALKIQLDALKAQLSQQASKPAAPVAAKSDEKLKQKLSLLEQTVEQLNRQLTQVRQQSSASLKDSAAQLSAAQQLLQQSQSEKSRVEAACSSQLTNQQNNTAQLQTQLQAVTQQLAASEQKNRSLVNISQELLTRYRDKGVLSALREKEPLTGLSRVTLETLVQEYGSKIRDQTQQPSSSVAPENTPGQQ